MNRFQTGQGLCRAILHKWGLAQSPSCDCGQRQTMNHTVDTLRIGRVSGRTVICSTKRMTTQSCGWNQQRLQHSRNTAKIAACVGDFRVPVFNGLRHRRPSTTRRRPPRSRTVATSLPSWPPTPPNKVHVLTTYRPSTYRECNYPTTVPGPDLGRWGPRCRADSKEFFGMHNFSWSSPPLPSPPLRSRSLRSRAP